MMDELSEHAAAAEPAPRNPVRTFKLIVAFDGTAYHGWQRQPNGITVQEVIETKLSRLFGDVPVRVQGSSRTDSGVHALGMCVSFKAPPSPYIPDWKVQKALNRLLPEDIRVCSAEVTDDSFNARFSALAKSYVYVVNTGELHPFVNRYAWQVSDMTRIDALREGIQYLQGVHDFSTFTVDRGKIDDAVRHILRVDLKCFGPFVCFYFLGTGFLYKMVRSMVGALMFVGRGALQPEDIRTMLEAKNRLCCKDTAPGRGLFLKRVFYRENEWEEDRLDKLPFHTI